MIVALARQPALALAALMLYMGASAAAQQPTGDVPVHQDGTVAVAPLPRRDASPAGERQPLDGAVPGPRILESVVLTGAPRTYHVVPVTAPAGLVAQGTIHVQLVAHSGFTIVGPRERLLPATRVRSLNVTLGVGSTSRAGHMLAAEAHFLVDGELAATVQIYVDVTPIHELRLRVPDKALLSLSGEPATIRVTVTNGGNVDEDVLVKLELPLGWRQQRSQNERRIITTPGQTVVETFRPHVPAQASTGSVFIPVTVTDARGGQSSASVRLEIMDSSSPARGAGPVVTASMWDVFDPSRSRNGALGVSVAGPLFDSVRVDGRLTQVPRASGAASQLLSRLGSPHESPYLGFSARSGRVVFGGSGTEISDLGGVYLYGDGAMLDLDRATWGVTAIAAASAGGTELGARQPLLAIRSEAQVRGARLFATASDLSDGELSPRELQSLSVGAALPLRSASIFTGEVARREFATGSGYGWSGELRRDMAENSAYVRVTHAPGGADAYARATDEVVGRLAQRLTARSLISVAGWNVSDATQIFHSVASSGWSLRPEYSIGAATQLAVEATSTRSQAVQRTAVADSDPQSFGTDERSLAVNITTSTAGFYLNGAVAAAGVARTLSGGTAREAQRLPKVRWALLATWTRSAGTLHSHTVLEEMRDNGGMVHRQATFGMRADDVKLPAFPGASRGMAELQYLNGILLRPSLVLRGGLGAPVPGGMTVKLLAERNPTLHAPGAPVKWLAAIRVDRALRVRMLRVPGVSGTVFEDRNGNGQRDRGEPGVGGVVLRRGEEIGVSDSRGRYRLAGDVRQEHHIDQGSIPDGWNIGQRRGSDVPLIASGTARVKLVVAARSGLQTIDVDLSDARILARDSRGREWLARMRDSSVAAFEALPVGTYDLVFDLSSVPEPLVPQGPVPQLAVVSGMSTAIAVTLNPRPLRMWTPPPSAAASQRHPATAGSPRVELRP